MGGYAKRELVFSVVGLLAALMLVTAIGTGCDPGVAPEEGSSTRVDFFVSPAADSLQVSSLETPDFQVGTRPSVPIKVRWVLDGDTLSVGPRFRYFPRHLEPSLLKAVASSKEGAFEHSWLLTIRNDHPAEFRFDPSGTEIALVMADSCRFQALGSYPFSCDYAWTMNGHEIPAGPVLDHVAREVGRDTLSLTVSTEVGVRHHTWYLNTSPFPVQFTFEPLESQVAMVPRDSRVFRLASDSPFPVSAVWQVDGVPVGTDSLLTFNPEHSGRHRIQVWVSSGERVFGHLWDVVVVSRRPPPVADILCDDGPSPGSVRVSWRPVEPTAAPVVRYEVACSHLGPLNNDSWNQAIQLEAVEPSERKNMMSRVFTPEDHGLVPGRRLWVAVKAVDTFGLSAEVVTNGSLTLSQAYHVQGVVRDETGRPLPGIMVRAKAQGLSAVTGTDGFYRLGPFPEGSSLCLSTESPDQRDPGESGDVGSAWYDYTTRVFDPAAMPVQDIYLLTRWGCDGRCSEFSNEFKTLFTYLTRTSLTTSLRPEHQLFHWEDYPVPVHIPVFQNNGLDFRELAAQSLRWWNTVLGEEVFQLVSSGGQARVAVEFTDLGGYANGSMTLVEPATPGQTLGDAVPQRIRVSISENFTDPQRIQETILHELGHVLGLYRHPTCRGPGYLMYITAAGALNEGWDLAVHQDEVRAVRAIRHLPQGYDVSGLE